jgi:hypothetical protein
LSDRIVIFTGGTDLETVSTVMMIVGAIMLGACLVAIFWPGWD